jgi:aminoglycoside/choline kinase family phosphotransferase
MKSTDDLILFARETLGFSEPVLMELIPFEGRGSDRSYFRLRWNGKNSAILVQYDPKRIENTYYADIAEFLIGIHIPVPRLIRHNPLDCLILMEDLGGADLWSFKNAPWDRRRSLYQQTLGIIQRLHSFPQSDFPSGKVKLMESFGPDYYRWERNYFLDNFVRVLCGIELETSFQHDLEQELAGLADRLAKGPYCLVHRDLQSSNVMIRNEEVFLIDFQGMRFGNPFYDIGSLLLDTYVSFTESEREELLAFDYRLSPWNMDWADFQNAFWEASVQRLMQALGAYGFLGIKKGLKAFLENVPAGLSNLQSSVALAPNLQHLRALLNRCQVSNSELFKIRVECN